MKHAKQLGMDSPLVAWQSGCCAGLLGVWLIDCLVGCLIGFLILAEFMKLLPRASLKLVSAMISELQRTAHFGFPHVCPGRRL